MAGVVPVRAALAAATAKAAEEVPVTATNLLDKVANNSPQLVRDPTDARVVILANRIDAPDYGCALQVSGDGGRSWLPADPVPELPAGAEKCYAPEAAFDRNGRLYYLFAGLKGLGNTPMGIFLVTSADRGATFSRPRKLLGPQLFSVRMAIDRDMGRRGRIHLVWIEATSPPPLGGFGPPPNPIMAAYSDDGGRTISTPVQVSDRSRARVAAPALALGPHHAVHVVYYDLKDDAVDYQGLEGAVSEDTWSLVSTSSSDGGRRFARGRQVDGSVVPAERVMLIYTMPPPSAVVDGAGRLYVAWHDARNGDSDVFVRHSDDQGKSWARAVRVNDDEVRNGHSQYLPRLSLAPGGRLDVIFYDRRRDRSNRGTDVYFSSSEDHGTLFGPNLPLTRLNFDSQIGPRYGVPSAVGSFEFGSRLALLSDRSRAFAAWTDTRNTLRGPPAQDIFAAEVELPGGRRGSGGRLPAAGIAIASGVGALVAWRLRRRARRSATPTSTTVSSPSPA